MEKIERLEEELEQAQLAYQLASQINRFQTGFLAKIAHELRSPLSSVMGLHQIILNDLCDNPEEEREFIQRAYESSEKLMKMIDTVIQVSKLSINKISLNTKTIQLSTVLDELYELTYLQANNKNVSLDIKFPDQEIDLNADLTILVQILVMLVESIISHLEMGKIDIHVNKTEHWLEINLDSSYPATGWQNPQEIPILSSPITLESVKDFSQKLEFSPHLKFTLVETLLEKMGGNLQLVELNSESAPLTLTRLQLFLPFSEIESK